MDYCTEWKSIYVNYYETNELVRAQIDTVEARPTLESQAPHITQTED